MLSSSNLQLSLFLMSTKSYLKFRTIRKKVGGFWKASIRDTPTKVGGFGKAPIRDTLPWVLESPYQRYPQKWVGFGKPLYMYNHNRPRPPRSLSSSPVGWSYPRCPSCQLSCRRCRSSCDASSWCSPAPCSSGPGRCRENVVSVRAVILVLESILIIGS